MKTIITFVLTLIVAVSLSAQRGAADPPGVVRSVSTPQTRQAEDQLRTAVVQLTDQIGACNAERGPLQQLSAKVMAGQLVTPLAALASFRAQFESANKGKSLDDKFVVIDKPAPSAKD